jgi:hypothetical protein
MIRRGWRGLSPSARAHIVVAALGFVVGAAFGDRLFVVVEMAVGHPVDKIVLGIAGAAIASLVYDIVMLVRGRRP